MKAFSITFLFCCAVLSCGLAIRCVHDLIYSTHPCGCAHESAHAPHTASYFNGKSGYVAASNFYPIGHWVKVSGAKLVVVKIISKGPFNKDGSPNFDRIDLSLDAFKEIADPHEGITAVSTEEVK